MSLARVKVLFRRNTYVGNDPALNTATINCERVASFAPVPAWLVRYKDGRSPDLQYYLTFTPSSEVVNNVNTLRGFWYEQTDNEDGMLIDVLSISDIINACNCVDCDSPDGNPVPSEWNGNPPQYVGPTPGTYCLTRVNTIAQGGANLTLVQQVVMDYTGQLENLRVISFNAGNGQVKLQGTSYTVPKPIGADVIASGAC